MSTTATLREGFRLLYPHSEGCWLTDHPQPFVIHDGIEWNLKKNGRPKGASAFHRFRCNDPDCEAILLVRVDVLSEWIGTGRG